MGTEEIHAAEEGKQPQLQYREELPPDCPPESAREITEPTTRYRLLRNPTAQESDFHSYAAKGVLRTNDCEEQHASNTEYP